MTPSTTLAYRWPTNDQSTSTARPGVHALGTSARKTSSAGRSAASHDPTIGQSDSRRDSHVPLVGQYAHPRSTHATHTSLTSDGLPVAAGNMSNPSWHWTDVTPRSEIPPPSSPDARTRGGTWLRAKPPAEPREDADVSRSGHRRHATESCQMGCGGTRVAFQWKGMAPVSFHRSDMPHPRSMRMTSQTKPRPSDQYGYRVTPSAQSLLGT
mmetsp:Transcript_10941/g.34749  ORF Transcript_10941/g.34749 Transcript_10941/m.34749 type:complete len:211 (-) Transcript_10941:1134-1766(-)